MYWMTERLERRRGDVIESWSDSAFRLNILLIVIFVGQQFGKHCSWTAGKCVYVYRSVEDLGLMGGLKGRGTRTQARWAPKSGLKEHTACSCVQ